MGHSSSFVQYVILAGDITLHEYEGNDRRDQEVRGIMNGMISIEWSQSNSTHFVQLLSDMESKNRDLHWRQELHEALAFPNGTQMDANGTFQFDPAILEDAARHAAYVRIYILPNHND